MKYQYVYKISVFLLFLGIFFILGSTIILSKTLNIAHWEWLIYGSILVIFASSIFIVFFRQESSENIRLNYKERKLNEYEEKLQQQQKEYQTKHHLLVQKENEIKQKLIQYQQYVEFPDKNGWKNNDNGYFDDEIAQLLQNKAEIIFDKIINQKYNEDKTFKNKLLFKDMGDLIDSVARIHHPDSQHPIMETSIENLLRSLNRLSLQLLVLVDSFPVNIKEYNLRKTYLYIQKSATTVGYYKKAEPFLTFVTPVLRIGMAANPMIGIAQTAAIEAGKHVIKKGSEKYALNLLHDVIEIIGEQASTIFGDSSLRYRSEHWIYAVELTEILHHFNPAKPEAISKAMKIINGLLLRSEYDRIYIYHCLAQGKSANPEKFENDFIDNDGRQKIVNKLRDFIENHINKERNEVDDKKVITWRKKVESRLGVEIPLNIDKNDADYLKNMLSSGSPEKKIPSSIARYILAMLDKGEIPQFIYTGIHFEASFQLEEIKELWLIGTNRRLMLLAFNQKDKIILIWRYDSRQNEQLSLHRINRIVADDCMIKGGLWQSELQMDKEPEFILEGKKISSYDSYFRVLEDFKRILS